MFRRWEVSSEHVFFTKQNMNEEKCDPGACGPNVGGGGASAWTIWGQKCDLYREADGSPGSCSFSTFGAECSAASLPHFLFFYRPCTTSRVKHWGHGRNSVMNRSA